MRFSTRTTYGLRAMAYLAREYPGRQAVPLKRIARDERLSPAYLESLFARLKREKLVKAVKGAGGGYLLAEAPGRTDVFRIVKALEGNVVPYHCIDSRGRIKCASGLKCGASGVLADVYAAISRTLKQIKLKDLV